MSTEPIDMDELLGAYALDAVDDEERRLVEAYLAENPRARAEVEQHRETATMLAWSGTDAPANAWEQIENKLGGNADADAAGLGRVIPIDERPRRHAVRTVVSWVAATAAAALIAVIAVNVSRDESPSSVEAAAQAAFADPALRHAQLSSPAGDDVRVLAVVDANGVGYLRAEALPELGSDRTYQLWGQVGEQLISLGLLGTDPDIITFAAQGDVSALAITDEVQGGVASSQNPAVVAGALT